MKESGYDGRPIVLPRPRRHARACTARPSSRSELLTKIGVTVDLQAHGLGDA